MSTVKIIKIFLSLIFSEFTSETSRFALKQILTTIKNPLLRILDEILYVQGTNKFAIGELRLYSLKQGHIVQIYVFCTEHNL